MVHMWCRFSYDYPTIARRYGVPFVQDEALRVIHILRDNQPALPHRKDCAELRLGLLAVAPHLIRASSPATPAPRSSRRGAAHGGAPPAPFAAPSTAPFMAPAAPGGIEGFGGYLAQIVRESSPELRRCDRCPREACRLATYGNPWNRLID